MSDPASPPVRLSLRLLGETGRLFGPGRADLLDHIAQTGSIAAAGRAMGMSYKRAWSLVEEMNGAACGPLVASARGGSGGGGATLTPAGEEARRLFRKIEEAVLNAAGTELDQLYRLLCGDHE